LIQENHDRHSRGGRRATSRADLILADLVSVYANSEEWPGRSDVYAGKGHPHDSGGKAIMPKHTFLQSEESGCAISGGQVVFLDDYNMDWGLK